MFYSRSLIDYGAQDMMLQDTTRLKAKLLRIQNMRAHMNWVAAIHSVNRG